MNMLKGPRKLGDVGLERVNGRDEQEQTKHAQRDERHQEGTPEARNGAVHLVVHAPMRGHLQRQLVVYGDAENSLGGDEQESNDQSGSSGHVIFLCVYFCIYFGDWLRARPK